MPAQPPIYLVSACLVGLCSRYDGQTRPHPECHEYLKNGIWIPFCPEQMGGLPTPRTAAALTHGDGNAVLAGKAKVITWDGMDVSRQFIQGMEQSLLLAQSQPVSAILLTPMNGISAFCSSISCKKTKKLSCKALKSGSPSCGVSGATGVTAARLHRHGFQLIEF